MERVRHQLACANCMLANTNPPVNKDYHFFVKIFPILFQISNSLHKDNICYATCCPISLLITHLLNEFILVACHSKVCDSTVWNGIDTQFGGFLEDILLL